MESLIGSKVEDVGDCGLVIEGEGDGGEEELQLEDLREHVRGPGSTRRRSIPALNPFSSRVPSTWLSVRDWGGGKSDQGMEAFMIMELPWNQLGCAMGQMSAHGLSLWRGSFNPGGGGGTTYTIHSALSFSGCTSSVMIKFSRYAGLLKVKVPALRLHGHQVPCQHVRRIPPWLLFLPVCLEAAHIDAPQLVFVAFIEHGGLADAQARAVVGGELEGGDIVGGLLGPTRTMGCVKM